MLNANPSKKILCISYGVNAEQGWLNNVDGM
jgi:hypothetical protein